MPFKTIAEGQEFVDLLVSRTCYRVWALAIDRHSANPDGPADDADEAWCQDFLLELVCASSILPGSARGLSQNANAAFLGRFQLQSWRFVLPDIYREICRIMAVENMGPRDRVFLLCKLPAVADASDQTAFADRFPWNLTAVPGSQQARWKEIIQAYRRFHKVGSNCFKMAANNIFGFQNVLPTRAMPLDDDVAMESCVRNVIYKVDQSLVWLAGIRKELEKEQMDTIRVAELLRSGTDRIRRE
jgi:hypothetical protein